MDVNGLPIIGPGVDYTQVGAIHQKRTLAFINHFISNTVSFLNKFARSCEQRLEKFDARIKKIDASLSVLETKLSSISALESAPAKCETKSAELSEPVPDVQHEAPPETKVQDPSLVRFFRMVQVGVPIDAVRMKMKAEGLDPSFLDGPDAVARVSDETSDSETSFSE
ncbi:hypothetical protein R5R35_006811 [Gryllus longicercus]|uniref:WASH complex subunit 3 n=1 Tax=Gryllus longicercus TaxID=2509291 RepID=A0AAN9VP52_9ORTH